MQKQEMNLKDDPRMVGSTTRYQRSHQDRYAEIVVLSLPPKLLLSRKWIEA